MAMEVEKAELARMILALDDMEQADNGELISMDDVLARYK